ncbi:MAG TPA: hypothetical protein VE194_12985, partial [Rubrobacter sp.]|nr:hypothetical protein [Rubrobacter sp.]
QSQLHHMSRRGSGHLPDTTAIINGYGKDIRARCTLMSFGKSKAKSDQKRIGKQVANEGD